MAIAQRWREKTRRGRPLKFSVDDLLHGEVLRQLLTRGPSDKPGIVTAIDIVRSDTRSDNTLHCLFPGRTHVLWERFLKDLRKKRLILTTETACERVMIRVR